MSNNSGYDGREPDSQVRSIIKQLNEERPSKEKSREVVVRADGTKVIRVVKKRKVMISGEEKARKAKRRFLLSLLCFFVIGGLVAGFFFVRMAMMSSDSYVQERQEKIREAWGAKSVRLINAQVHGFTFTAERMVVEFPESSMLASVELSDISADLASGTFFRGIPIAKKLEIGKAVLCLREGADKLQMPTGNSRDLWEFQSIECKNFSLVVGDEVTSPVSIKGAFAYAYKPSGGGSSTVVTLEGGQLALQGWKTADLVEGKVMLAADSLDNFSFNCTIPADKSDTTAHPSQFIFSGSLKNGKPLAGPYRFLGNRMPLDMITDDAFSAFFTGVINDKLSVDTEVKSLIRLPFDGKGTRFMGTFALEEAKVWGMDALAVLNNQVNLGFKGGSASARSLQFRDASVELTYDEEDGAKKILTLREMGFSLMPHLRGALEVDAHGGLSGTLEYGVRYKDACAEYTDKVTDKNDGFYDPIFTDTDRRTEYVWFITTVSGTSKSPKDNAVELDREAEPRRDGHKRLDLPEPPKEGGATGQQKSGTETKTTPADNDGGDSTEPEPATTPSSTDTPKDDGTGGDDDLRSWEDLANHS